VEETPLKKWSFLYYVINSVELRYSRFKKYPYNSSNQIKSNQLGRAVSK